MENKNSDLPEGYIQATTNCSSQNDCCAHRGESLPSLDQKLERCCLRAASMLGFKGGFKVTKTKMWRRVS